MVIYFPYLLTNVTYNDVVVFLGHVCEKHNNPADFFLDVICANESSVVEGTCNYNLFMYKWRAKLFSNIFLELMYMYMCDCILIYSSVATG